MEEARIERLRVLLRSTVIRDLEDFVRERADNARDGLLHTSELPGFLESKGAANALYDLLRAFDNLRQSDPEVERIFVAPGSDPQLQG